MATSLTTIATDRRHIDPNPDRLALFSSGSLPTPQPLSSTSLLLLSTSAEAAVLESRRFERGSRHSSLSASLGSPPPLPPTPPQPQPQAQPAPASRPQQSPLRRHSNHHHNLHHHRLHHRFADAVAIQPAASNHPAQHTSSAATNGGTLTKRDGAKNGHLFKCEKCLKPASKGHLSWLPHPPTKSRCLWSQLFCCALGTCRRAYCAPIKRGGWLVDWQGIIGVAVVVDCFPPFFTGAFFLPLLLLLLPLRTPAFTAVFGTYVSVQTANFRAPTDLAPIDRTYLNLYTCSTCVIVLYALSDDVVPRFFALCTKLCFFLSNVTESVDSLDKEVCLD